VVEPKVWWDEILSLVMVRYDTDHHILVYAALANDQLRIELFQHNEFMLNTKSI